MLPWYQWLILGLVPPLIFILYFLKLRRVPLEVPSTYLWTKTVEDLHVNSIWQKLRKNLLLLLQLIAVSLLMLTCLRPGCEGTKLAGDRFIFVVDQSASMSATDTEKGVSRLEEAKEQIYGLLRDMKSTDAAMVISFSDRAVVQQSYTTNKELLRRKIKLIQQTQRGSDINEALTAASGLANPGRTSDKTSERDVQVADALAATLFIFSDGQVKEVPKFIFGNLSAEYRPVGTLIGRPDNLGITAFAINSQLESDSQIQVFARLLNSGDEDKTANIALYVNDELQDARQVEIPGRGDKDIAGGNSVPLNFDLTQFATELESAVPIRLEIEDKDVYMQDNVAYTVLNPARMATILVVSDYNKYLEYAFNTSFIEKVATIQFEDRDYLKDEEYLKSAALGMYDLVVYDQCQPETMPSCNTVFWGDVPLVEGWAVKEEVETTPIVDLNNNHSVMFGVQLGTVNILQSNILDAPKGSVVLVESVNGPVMTIGPRGGFEDLVIGFPLMQYEDDGDVSNNTDWQNIWSFPLFVQNVVMNLAVKSSVGNSKNQTPGDLVKIRTQIPYPEIDVLNPASSKTSLKIRSDNSFVYSDAQTSGIYSVSEKGESNAEQMFAVNLMDRQESNLEVRDELSLGYEELEQTIQTEPSRRDFWTAILLAALVVLTIEWYIYNRRVFI
jgi:hypothetical protein